MQKDVSTYVGKYIVVVSLLKQPTPILETEASTNFCNEETNNTVF